MTAPTAVPACCSYTDRLVFHVDWSERHSFVVRVSFDALKKHLIRQGTVISLACASESAKFIVEKSSNGANTIGPGALFRLGIMPENYSGYTQNDQISLFLSHADQKCNRPSSQEIGLLPVYTRQLELYKTAIENAFKYKTSKSDTFYFQLPFLAKEKEIVRVFFKQSFLESSLFNVPLHCVIEGSQDISFDFVITSGADEAFFNPDFDFKVDFSKFAFERFAPTLSALLRPKIITDGQKILDDAFRLALCQTPPKPQLLLVKGCNGSGMTTAVHGLEAKYGISIDFIDCYSRHEELKKGGFKAVLDQTKSSVMFLNDLNYCLWEDNSSQTSQGSKLVFFVEFFVAVLVDGLLRMIRKRFSIGIILLKTDCPDQSEAFLKNVEAIEDAFNLAICYPEINVCEKAELYRLLCSEHCIADQKNEKLVVENSSNFYDIQQFSLMEENAFQKYLKDRLKLSEISDIKWTHVGGLQNVKSFLMETLKPSAGRSFCFGKRNGILLYGPPGTGKTLIARAVANEFSYYFLSVKGPELLNMYIGESESNIRKVFREAQENAPCILFFDELDSVVPKRSATHSASGSVMDRIVSQFITEMDTISQNQNIFVIGSTNRLDLIDSSLLRAGRFDSVLFLDQLSDCSEKLQVFKAALAKYTVEHSMNDEEIIQIVQTRYPEKVSAASIAEFVQNAVQCCIAQKITELKAKSSSEYPEVDCFEYVSHHATNEELKCTVTAEHFMQSLAV